LLEYLVFLFEIQQALKRVGPVIVVWKTRTGASTFRWHAWYETLVKALGKHCGMDAKAADSFLEGLKEEGF
jgi:hypothetical protein